MKLRVGTRKSELALNQTYWVVEKLKKYYPDIEIEIHKLTTKGDEILDKTLSKIGGKALFLKEIQNALLAGDIDLAVHSMKDIPTETPSELEICAVTKRLDPRDVLITKDNNSTLDELQLGSFVGTSSLRRASQLKAYRKDLQITPVRGNINTRLEKLQNSDKLDGIVLAKAGLMRADLTDLIAQEIPEDVIVPCVGQGALGIEIKADNDKLREKLSVLNDENSRTAIYSERTFLNQLGGSCHVPVGGLGRLTEKGLELTGVVAELEGSKVLKETLIGSKDYPVDLGQELAYKLISQGAKEILDSVKNKG
ncbi:hydroxymethylbilane synthase [Natranaerobius trueperi]|uniref:Porphobilinogen deaminase n=1 Tax=Natranaerobius trueperi TaxID=759412 RepID=A0A226BXF4_9FIRM|nr:hydroxymethylbilane synthase [Natranaerobius trueperi]OWZ82879.1 hydroxymethylbilane synthase [Natranaerobius trueperi]